MDLANLLLDHSLLLLLLLTEGSDSENLITQRICKHKIIGDQLYRKTKFGQELERFIRQHINDMSDEKMKILVDYEIYVRVLELADSMLRLFENDSAEPVFLINDYEVHIDHLQELNLISRLKYQIGSSTYSLAKRDKTIKEKYLTFTYYKGVRTTYGHGKRYHKMLGKLKDYKAGAEDPKAMQEAKDKYFEEVLAHYDSTRPDINDKIDK